MGKIIKNFQYTILFIIFIILNFATFGYQEAMMDVVGSLLKIFVSFGIYLVFYFIIVFLVLAIKRKTKISKRFIKYNLLFPFVLILIGAIYKIFGLDYDAKVSENIKLPDFLAIVGFMIFVSCRVKSHDSKVIEEKTIEEDKIEFIKE